MDLSFYSTDLAEIWWENATLGINKMCQLWNVYLPSENFYGTKCGVTGDIIFWYNKETHSILVMLFPSRYSCWNSLTALGNPCVCMMMKEIGDGEYKARSVY